MTVAYDTASQNADFADLKLGQSASFSKTVTEADIILFSGVSGDVNPAHIDQNYAANSMFKGRIAHGMLSASFISAVLGTRLPGARHNLPQPKSEIQSPGAPRRYSDRARDGQRIKCRTQTSGFDHAMFRGRDFGD